MGKHKNLLQWRFSARVVFSSLSWLQCSAAGHFFLLFFILQLLRKTRKWFPQAAVLLGLGSVPCSTSIISLVWQWPKCSRVTPSPVALWNVELMYAGLSPPWWLTSLLVGNWSFVKDQFFLLYRRGSCWRFYCLLYWWRGVVVGADSIYIPPHVVVLNFFWAVGIGPLVSVVSEPFELIYSFVPLALQ